METKQQVIRDYIRAGAVTDITDWNIKTLNTLKGYADRCDWSVGKYGLNGAMVHIPTGNKHFDAGWYGTAKRCNAALILGY